MLETRSGIDRDRGHRLRSRGHRPCETSGFVISIVDIVEGGGFKLTNHFQATFTPFIGDVEYLGTFCPV